MSGHSTHVRHLQAVPVVAAPMTQDDLWAAVESLSRLLGEVSRRRLDPEVYGQVDQARMIALGLYSVTG